MRQYLRQRGEATAADLAIEADLCGSTGNVYALLKNDIAKGAIELRGQHYVWVDSFDAQKQQLIQEAIRSLRRAGYTVIKEGRMTAPQHLQIALHPVTASMPDADTDVLIFDATSPVGQLGAYMGDDDNGPLWCDAHGQPVTGVTHWCEMPTRQDHVGGSLG